jgi:ubiquinone/menaquinone biosynthesis C-methylase UbiE
VQSRPSLRRFGQVFDAVADAYDEVRPSYPAALVDAAAERGRLGAGSRVLEVGCGTGKLTELLTARGLVVDAVDPGANMVAAARKRVGDGGVRFHVARFEDVELPRETFAAVFSATAFHWVDPAVGWARAAALLRTDGLLALLTHVVLRDDLTADTDHEFRTVVEQYAPEIVERWAPRRSLDAIVQGADARRANVSEAFDWVMGGGHRVAIPDAEALFADAEIRTVEIRTEETADEGLAVLRTTSLYFMIDAERRLDFEADYRRYVQRIGGVVRLSKAAVLVMAPRRRTTAAGSR